uniref:Putative secreted protein n=1 Tax=Xenopsylla cheopis TaxID=163159 RepID=A0A6M2E3B6_XENCH
MSITRMLIGQQLTFYFWPFGVTCKCNEEVRSSKFPDICHGILTFFIHESGGPVNDDGNITCWPILEAFICPSFGRN